MDRARGQNNTIIIFMMRGGGRDLTLRGTIEETVTDKRGRA